MRITNQLFALFLVMTLLFACSEDSADLVIDDNTDDGIVDTPDEMPVEPEEPQEPDEPAVLSRIPATGFMGADEYEGFQLRWADEFNGTELSLDDWSYDLGTGCPGLCFWGNNEQQFYTNEDDNLYFVDGNLIIEAKREFRGGLQYTSSRIRTQDKQVFQYGRVDIRAAMPIAHGTWVAFWMLNNDYDFNDPGLLWPSGGEIDIVEYLGEDHMDIFGTAHFGTDFPDNWRFISGRPTLSNVDYSEEFHVYSIIWEEDRITWLLDDVPYHSIEPQTTLVRGQPYPFNDEFFITLNMSVGGNLPDDPIPTEYPDYVIIDYVRVFEPVP